MQDSKEKMKQLAKEFANCRTAFTAMGDENRQLIMISLMCHFEGMRVNDIAQETHLSRPAVSHHLKVLTEAGIVEMYSIGTKNFYHMSGKEANWKRFTDLIQHVEKLMNEMSEEERNCGKNDE